MSKVVFPANYSLGLSRGVSLLLAWSLVLLLGGVPAVAGTGIVGSQHDFSDESWNPDGEVCIVCHLPHDEGRDTGLVGLLWNHQLSVATYELYSSPLLEETPEQPRAPSKRCLGCHDGTVGLDAFSGRPGSNFITGEARIGTDLSMTHPISIRWTHQESPDCGNCHNVHGKDPTDVTFYDGYVECPSCHEPHDTVPGNYPDMLRKSMDKSFLCFHCHDK